MAIPKKHISAGAGALVQRVKLVFAGYEFQLPTDPAAVDPSIPFPQLVVALALQLATMMQALDDIVVATRHLDAEQLRKELIALAGLNKEAAIRVELQLDALEQVQAMSDAVVGSRLAHVLASEETDGG
jgi:hypothetical protein